MTLREQIAELKRQALMLQLHELQAQLLELMPKYVPVSRKWYHKPGFTDKMLAEVHEQYAHWAARQVVSMLRTIERMAQGQWRQETVPEVLIALYAEDWLRKMQVAPEYRALALAEVKRRFQ